MIILYYHLCYCKYCSKMSIKFEVKNLKKCNVILVYSSDGKDILFCKREKEPYKGKYNLVGGKVEEGEESLESAYRELFEETGIKKENICLTHLMDFDYNMSNFRLEVFAGKLEKDVTLIEEVNKLYWIDKKSNFFDMNIYAGEGNIGHMVEQVNCYKEKIFKD